jgi:hypothetical protein
MEENNLAKVSNENQEEKNGNDFCSSKPMRFAASGSL